MIEYLTGGRSASRTLATDMRVLPLSPSYFTGSSKFTDSLLGLQRLVRKSQSLPALSNPPKVLWKTLGQFNEEAGTRIGATEYRQFTHLLSRLHAINPAFHNPETKQVVDTYQRPDLSTVRFRPPKVVDDLGRSNATGRRKRSVARVWLVAGEGKVMVNGKSLADYFCRVYDRQSVLRPLTVCEKMASYNVWCLVQGGGLTGQAEAIALGVARALLVHEPELKPWLRKAGAITRDPRKVERKKPGHVKARKMPTWVKR